MKTSRLIRIIGTIDEEAFKAFSERLAEYEAESHKAVVIELSSGGGSAYDALAFAGRMRTSPCDIEVRAYGFVASAAVLILAAGDFRMMAKEAWVMVHEDSGKIKGNVTDLEREANQFRRLENQWAQLLADLCNGAPGMWQEMHKVTTHLTAVQCLNLKLVDEII